MALAPSTKPDLSIIVPIKNERDNIEELVRRIQAALALLDEGFRYAREALAYRHGV